jgi:predicted RNase H-like nuclease (RuvC/YqgF family)
MSQGANEPGQEPGQQAAGGQGQEPPANGTQQGQEPSGGQGQEPNQQGDQIDLSTIQDPALRAYLENVQKDTKEARDEAARYRTERNTLQQAEAERQRANETEAQRLERERQEQAEETARLKRENEDLRKGQAVTKAAEKAKALNPSTVYALIKDRVTLDDQGQPNNVDDLLKDLRKTDAYLFARGANADAGEGNGDESAPTGSMNDRIRDLARRGRVTPT